MVQQHRGLFRVWNAALLAATFVLCIFGTYLTRSGLVDSVHGFGQSLVGTFFLVFLVTVVVFAIGLIIWRIRKLRGAHALEELVSREGAFLATNIVLAGMTLVVLIGTIYPVISRWFASNSITLGPSFYNKVVAPTGLLVVGLMAFGPLLIYGKGAARRVARGSAVPVLVGILAAAAVWAGGFHNAWAVACAAIVGIGVTAAVVDFVKVLVARSHHENPLLALFRLLDHHHRRYGGQIVHIGMLLTIIGVTGSSVFSKSQKFQINPGQTASFAGFNLKLNSINQSRVANYLMTQADLTVTDANGVSIALKPELRVYDKWEEQNSSVVAIDTNWKRDLYVSLAGWDEDGQNVALQAFVNPLVSWIWCWQSAPSSAWFLLSNPYLPKRQLPSQRRLRCEKML
jgi:cytochrome c-type biogenesis protein CcmF